VINSKIELNEYDKIALDEWIKTPEIRPNVSLGEFIIMPNHVHAIIRLLGRGELHSPEFKNELHSPGITNELHSPEFNNELHSPGITNELHSPGITNEMHSPGITNELHSPEFNNELHSPGITNEMHSPGITNELHSPEFTNELHSPEFTNEMHSSENNGGVCQTSQPTVNIRGVCKTPLRSPSQTVGAIVRGYKSSVSKQLRLLGFNGKLWQRNYHEHIIRDEKSHRRISDYIINNPAKWGNDKFYIE